MANVEHLSEHTRQHQPKSRKYSEEIWDVIILQIRKESYKKNQ
jgi:hypothetical protein